MQFPPGQNVANNQIKDSCGTLHLVQEHVHAAWEHLWGKCLILSNDNLVIPYRAVHRARFNSSMEYYCQEIPLLGERQ